MMQKLQMFGTKEKKNFGQILFNSLSARHTLSIHSAYLTLSLSLSLIPLVVLP